MLLSSYLSYYFGYKKKGTRFLACVVFFGWLKLIIDIFKSIPKIETFYKSVTINPMLMSNISYIIEISMACVTVYYLINSRKLYKLNYFLKYGPKSI